MVIKGVQQQNQRILQASPVPHVPLVACVHILFTYRLWRGIGLPGHEPRRLLPQIKQRNVAACVDAGKRVVVGVQDPIFPAGTCGKVEIEFPRILGVLLW